MTPDEVGTNETLRFVLQNISLQRQRILEVGCGNGELAKRLHELGHDVVAIDSSVEAIANAQQLELDARVASFPDFDDLTFDVMLFTRSLHHIRPLEPALEQARRLIKPSGLLIVEDFAYSDTSEHTTVWFYRLLKLLEACGVLLPAEDSFGRKVLKAEGDISIWREHVHEINSAKEVAQAIGKRFQVQKTRLAPYLYRYVSEMVPDDA